ncbi:MAG: acetolactate synthase small subunit [Desulfarculaceae bacterium]|jgi:acetolactate synthase-1/3 small subunit
MSDLNPISLLVRNERGVLARVAGLLARRGFNIVSLAVGETENPRLSRMSVVVRGDAATLDQAVKQLRRLVSVVKVQDLSQAEKVETGLALIKVQADAETRGEIAQLANIFRAHVEHVDLKSMIVEVSGNREKVQAMIHLLRPYGIIEMARTGQIMVSRHGVLDESRLSERPVSNNQEAPEDGSGETEIFNLFKYRQGE